MRIRILPLRFLATFLLLLNVGPIFADKTDLGLPACEQIVGTDRNIEIGNTVSYTVEYLEKNNYRCDEFKGRVHEVISCSYRLDRKFEVLLIVEDGYVTDIETLSNGAECSYFNILPKNPCEDPFEMETEEQLRLKCPESR